MAPTSPTSCWEASAISRSCRWASLPAGLRQRLVRREVLRLAVSARHPLAGTDQVELSALKDERFEVFPRQASPATTTWSSARAAPRASSRHSRSTAPARPCGVTTSREVAASGWSSARCVEQHAARDSARRPGPATADAGHQRGVVRRRRAADGRPLPRRRRVAGGRARLAEEPDRLRASIRSSAQSIPSCERSAAAAWPAPGRVRPRRRREG